MGACSNQRGKGKAQGGELGQPVGSGNRGRGGTGEVGLREARKPRANRTGGRTAAARKHAKGDVMQPAREAKTEEQEGENFHLPPPGIRAHGDEQGAVAHGDQN